MAVALVLLAGGASRRMAPLGHKLLLPYGTWQALQSHAAFPAEACSAFIHLPQYKVAPPLFLFSLGTLVALAAAPSTFSCIALDPEGPQALHSLCYSLTRFNGHTLQGLHIAEAPPARSAKGGQTASLQAALAFAKTHAYSHNVPLEGALVLLADMPSITPTLAFSVLNQFQQCLAAKTPAACIAPAFGNAHGHPVAIPAAFFPAIMALEPEEKLWPVLAPACQLLQQPTPACLFDIDTPAAYAGDHVNG